MKKILQYVCDQTFGLQTGGFGAFKESRRRFQLIHSQPTIGKVDQEENVRQNQVYLFDKIMHPHLT